MQKIIKSAVMAVTAVIFVIISASVSSATETSRISHGKDDSRSHYMGMASLNISPWIPGPLIVAPALSLHTSHGAYFPKLGIYTGASAEVIYSFFGTVMLSSHTRYYYPANAKKRVQGYVGLEAGFGCGYSEPVTAESFFFNGATELGFVVNYRKVSLDIGIRAQYMPPYTINFILLPVKIGLIF